MPEDPQASFFHQMTLANGPLTRGIFEPAPPALNLQSAFGNLPFMQGPQGGLVQMALEGVLGQVLGPGFVPGQFAPQMNAYDFARRRSQTAGMQAAMAAAQGADRQGYIQFLRGLTATAGLDWNETRAKAAGRMADDMGRFAPMLAPLLGDTFDALHGQQGSAMFLAQNLFQGGRYALDPVTGRTGLSGESAGQMARQIHEHLYGPGSDQGTMQGLGASRAGQLYDELQRRGLGTAFLPPEQRRTFLARQEARAGRAASPEDALARMDALGDGPQLDTRLRQLEAGRVGDRLKSMAGAVAAMKDIFGDMGNPNAPMAQLVEGLQVLTQGGMQHFDPARVERIARDVSNIARRTGVGVDSMTQMMAQGGQQAQMLGVDRAFVPGASMGAAAFGQAFGLRAGGTPAWGRASKDELMMMDQQLSLNASKSVVANQLAATLRLTDEMEGAGQMGNPDGVELRLLRAALKNHQSVYRIDGQDKTVFQQPDQLEKIVQRGGGDVVKLRALLRQHGENARTVYEYDLGETARDLQGRLDMAPVLRNGFVSAFRQSPWAGQAREMAQKVSEALRTMDPAQVQDASAVAAAASIAFKSPQERAAFQAAFASGRGEVQRLIEITPQIAGIGTFDNLVQLNNARNLKERRLQREEATSDSKLQTAMSSLGRAGPLARLVDTIRDTTPLDSFQEVLGKVLGYQPAGKVGEALEGPALELAEQLAAYEGIDSQAVRQKAKELKEHQDELIKQGRPEEAAAVGRRLQMLAKVHTGGDIGKLSSFVAPKGDAERAQIRRSALEAIDRLVPQLRDQGTRHGLGGGLRVQPGEAQKVAAALQGDPTAALRGTDSLVEGLLYDEAALGRLGSLPGADGTVETATDTVKGIDRRNRRLKQLARQFGEGDLGSLLASDDLRQRAQGLVAEKAAAKTEMMTAVALRDKLLKEKVDPAGGQAAIDQKNAAVQDAINQKEAAEKRYNANELKMQQYQEQFGANPERAGVMGAAKGDALAARKEAQDLLTTQRAAVDHVHQGLKGRADVLAVAGLEAQEAQEALKKLQEQKADPARIRAASDAAGLASQKYQDLQAARTLEQEDRRRFLKLREKSDVDLAGQFDKLFGWRDPAATAKALEKDQALLGERGLQARELTPALERLADRARAQGLSLPALLGTGQKLDEKAAAKEVQEARQEQEKGRQELQAKARAVHQGLATKALTSDEAQQQLTKIYQEAQALEAASREKIDKAQAPLQEAQDRKRVRQMLGDIGKDLTPEELARKLKEAAAAEPAAKERKTTDGRTQVHLTSGEIKVNLTTGNARFDATGEVV